MPERIVLTQAQRAALDLTRNVATTAGAGSGKTSVLVLRYIKALEAGGVSVRNVLAITFTDKAAAEMKERVRGEIQARISRGEDIPRWRTVLDELDHAAISTIHSFCGSLLREYPVEADVDPLFETLDESESRRLRAEAVEEALQTASEEESGLRPHAEVLLRLWGRNRVTTNIRMLLERSGPAEGWAAFYSNSSDEEIRKKILSLATDALMRKGRALFSREMIGRLAAFQCADQTDLIEQVRNETLRLLGEGLARPDHETFTGLLPSLKQIKLTGGRANNWDDLAGCKKLLKEIREGAGKLDGFAAGEADWSAIPVLRATSALCGLAREIYERYKGDGRKLDFDDLQRRALRLLRQDKGGIRGRLHGRFRAVLVDEFQDTNHLQWEIIRLIVERPDGTVPAGKLLIVGDPKQSIYGFRDAEIRVFDEVRRSAFDERGRVEIDDNFRAGSVPIAFVNRLMENLMGKSGLDYDPEYRPLVGRRESTVEGSVTLLLPQEGDGAHDGNDEENWAGSECEADLVARQIQCFVQRGVQVWDKEQKHARPAGYGDVAILLRARTRLGLFEEALRTAGVPFTVGSGFSFYQRQEVLDIANVLRFLLHRDDDVALAAVLRSPLVGVPDDALYRMTRAKGENLWAKVQKAEVTGALCRGLEMMRGWVRWARRMPVAELLMHICGDAGLWGAAAGGERGPQRVANVEKIIALARGASDLAAFVEQLDELIETQAREAEAPAEFDERESVAILTIHAAKGLEFPIVCLADVGAEVNRRRPTDILVHRDYGFGIKTRTGDESFADTVLRKLIGNRIEEEEKAESLRLLYVALTRARDHLVISGTRRAGKARARGSWLDVICNQMGVDQENPRDVPEAAVHVDASRIPVAGPAAEVSLDEFLARYRKAAASLGTMPEEEDERLALLRPIVCEPTLPRFSPTGLMRYLTCPYSYFLAQVLGAPSAGSPADDMPELAGISGKHAPGVVVGVVAHRLFEVISEMQPGSEEHSALQYLEELQIADSAERERLARAVATMVEGFRASEFGAKVLAAEEHYSELAFAVPAGRGVVSGAIDCLYRDAAGWHILDYKTDDVAEEELAARCERYRPQLLIYSIAAGKLLGCAPPDAYLYFTRIARPVGLAVGPNEAEAFQRRLTDAIDRILEKEFTPAGACPADCEFRESGYCEVRRR